MSENPNTTIKKTFYYCRSAALADWKTEIVELPSDEFENAKAVYKLTHHYELYEWQDAERIFKGFPPDEDVKKDYWSYVLLHHEEIKDEDSANDCELS